MTTYLNQYINISGNTASFSNTATVQGLVSNTNVVINGQTLTAATGNILAINGSNLLSASSTANIVTTGTISAGGNITGAYILGDGSQLTNLPAGGYSNANVSAYLSSGTLSSNVVTTASVVAGNVVAGTNAGNIVILGNSIPNAISTTQWVTATTSTTANIVLFQVPETNVASLDIYIVATIPSFLSRQVSKIMSVNMSGTFNYSEYGSLTVGVPVADFTMGVAGGNVVLYVTPSSNYTTQYKVVVTQYSQ